MGRAKGRRRRGTAAIAIGTALLAAVLAAALGWLAMENAAQAPHDAAGTGPAAAQHGGGGHGHAGHGGGSPWPDIDWAAWRAANPDVVGWITIPGTHVDYPVMQARPDAPDWYLRHDARGNWSLFGCPYIDADCKGFASDDTVIYGHNMGLWDTSMFHDLSLYTDESYGSSRRTVYLQTPERKWKVEIRAATVIGGWQAEKFTDFPDTASYRRWWRSACGGCGTRYWTGGLPVRDRAVTLVTCSYHFWDDERTLVYAN